MAGPFRVVVADPPWAFGDQLPGKTRGAAKQYRCLPLREIETFLDDRPELQIADDALLFLWRVSAMAEDAYKVARAWGFEPKSEIVWVKTSAGGVGLHFGMGRYVRAAHETCIIARRGRAKVLDRSVRSVFFAGTGAHSQKPEQFFRLVEKLTDGPRLELFARRQRPGWTCLGDEMPDQITAAKPHQEDTP